MFGSKASTPTKPVYPSTTAEEEAEFVALEQHQEARRAHKQAVTRRDTIAEQLIKADQDASVAETTKGVTHDVLKEVLFGQ